MKITAQQFETEIFEYVDRIKELLSAEIWQNILLDCSKNELFVLWLLFRQEEVNMTQIAEYIQVPLNTATGIVNRMEKRQLVTRVRSAEDKRVVTVHIGEKGAAQMQAVLSEFMYYAGKMVEAFSADEMDLLFQMFRKLTDIMREPRQKASEKTKIKKINIE